MQTSFGSRATSILVFTLLAALSRPGIASEKQEFGTVRLPKGMTVEVRRSITGTGEPAILPQGAYSIRHWSIRRTDANDVSWTCEGSIPEEQSALAVVASGETQVPVGEPLSSVLTAERRGSVFTFNHRLQGRLGESVSIDSKDARGPAPKLRIRSADGSYDQTLTFEYG